MNSIFRKVNTDVIELKSICFLLLLFFFVVSCSKDDTISTDKLGEFNSKTILHDGEERSYQFYLPTNFDKSIPTPLVFALHGGGGTGARFEDAVSGGTLTEAAEARGVVLLMPDGIDKRWNSGRSEIFGEDKMHDDVGFISVLIDMMIQDYGIDERRVYSTGISNGGFMSIKLAFDLSEKLAAIAPVTAQLADVPDSYVPNLPVSIMIINGTDDPLVPYDGGCVDVPGFPDCSRGIVLSTDETIEKYIGYNECANAPVVEPNVDEKEDGTSVEVTRYNECSKGSEVVLVKVIGGGHTWPSGAQYLPAAVVGKVSKEINASEMILDFFLEHSRN